jgi:hypothetical protein
MVGVNANAVGAAVNIRSVREIFMMMMMCVEMWLVEKKI